MLRGTQDRTLQTLTVELLRGQQLYVASKATLKLQCDSYNITTGLLFTN